MWLRPPTGSPHFQKISFLFSFVQEPFTMATTFNPDEPLAGLPPKHVMDGSYTPVFEDKLKQEEAISFVKNNFEDKLKENVNLTRVSCPMFVTKRSGFNDNLNGVERPATFVPRDFQDIKLEVPFSLAKWKRWADVSIFETSRSAADFSQNMLLTFALFIVDFW